MKNKRGITLIALIVTIIVLLILAGVSILFLTGDKGILSKATSAKSESQKGAAVEKLNLKIQSLITSKNGIAKLIDLNEFVDNSSSNYDSEITLVAQVQLADTEAKINMDGYTFTINNALKISSIDGDINQLPVNTATTTQGTEVTLPEGWGTTATRNISTSTGLEVSSVKISSVYAVAVGDGVSVPVPYGFYYVGGNLNTGVIISDNQADSYTSLNLDRSGYTYCLSATTNHLVGNQFVFISCDLSSYKKTDWGKGNAGFDTSTNAAEYNQIEKYGGFYVARFEAGLATTITPFSTTQSYSSTIYNVSGAPQSKAEQVPWNHIDWINSKANAEKMYKTDYVYSGLVTGTQFDVILNTMINKGTLTTSDITTNSSNFGDYTNCTASFSGIYSIYNGSEYPFGNTSVTGYNLHKTGESQNVMKYGISDIAGGLWEWTEEVSTYSSGSYKVFRGGSYHDNGNNYMACYRYGTWLGSSGAVGSNIGYRVVLYMK